MKPALATGVLLAALVSCGRITAHVARFGGATMGTTYGIQIVDGPPRFEASDLHARVDGLLRGIERKMSTYDPESELSRFNASDSTDWFAVSADTLTVIEEALRVSRLTGGAFDVTVGPLVELWGFGARGPRRRPEPEAIAVALRSVGYRGLETRSSPPSIRRRVAGLRVDLSAIAKGFAVDEVARMLEAEGVRHFLVEIGGELRARGHNLAGEPWRIGVEPPRPAGRAPARALRLVDAAVATSGDYRNAFEEGGVRYAHVLDPRTGRPVATAVASATVLASSAIEADAFATAMMVIPSEEALLLAVRNGLAVRLLVRTDEGFAEHTTPAFPVGPTP